MTVAPLIFTKDRPAQLDLLLRSLEAHGDGFSRPTVLARWSDHRFYRAYEEVLADHNVEWLAEYDFETQVRALVARAASWEDGLFLALCDDDVLYRDLAGFDIAPAQVLLSDESVICFSLRLGLNTQVCYPMRRRQKLPLMAPRGNAHRWDWRDADGDFGYPASLDGHLFGAADVVSALARRSFWNPNTLEDALVAGLRNSPRVRMASYYVSALVGNPLNRTTRSHQTNRVSDLTGVGLEEMTARFLAGERLSFATVDARRVDGAHCEFAPVWEPRATGEIAEKNAAGIAGPAK